VLVRHVEATRRPFLSDLMQQRRDPALEKIERHQPGPLGGQDSGEAPRIEAADHFQRLLAVHGRHLDRSAGGGDDAEQLRELGLAGGNDLRGAIAAIQGFGDPA
jgi:hypothetical protein